MQVQSGGVDKGVLTGLESHQRMKMVILFMMVGKRRNTI